MPHPADTPGEHAGGQQEAKQRGERPGPTGYALADDADHQHVRPGGELSEAVDADELVLRDPVMLRLGLLLHLRQHRGPAADRQDRQQTEHAEEIEDLAHEPTTATLRRGRYHHTARGPM